MASITDLRLGVTPADLSNASPPMVSGSGLNVLAEIEGGGGGSNYAAAPHWRIRNLAFADPDFWTVAELEMAATASGADLCVGGTPSASNTAAGSAASRAFDNDVNIDWRGGVQSNLFGAWLAYAFGSPVLPAEIRLRGSANAGLAICNTRAFVAENSQNGTDWSPVKAFVTNTPWSVGELRSFALDGSQTFENDISNARAWEIRITSIVSGEFIGATEIQFATAGGTNLSVDGAGYSDKAWLNSTEGNPQRLFDGNNSTGYYSFDTGSPVPARIGYVRSAPMSAIPDKVRIAPNGNSNEKITAFEVRWSADFVNWNVYRTFSGISSAWTNGVFRDFAF